MESVVQIIISSVGAWMALNGFFIAKEEYKNLDFGWSMFGTGIFGIGVSLIIYSLKIT